MPACNCVTAARGNCGRLKVLGTAAWLEFLALCFPMRGNNMQVTEMCVTQQRTLADSRLG
jgi:hypothetical protein